MIPTLNGRLQTRIFAILVIGGLWTLIITPILPGTSGAPLGDLYEVTFSILLTVLVLGIGWEFIYHGLQQFRWEKDWPTLFGLLTGINEGVLLWILLEAGVVPNADPSPFVRTWLTHFATTWVIIWLWLNGPMKVIFLRWRVRGGRIIGA
jgi:hypothetical protein